MSESYTSDKAPEPVGLYPHARKVGNMLFLSGVGPRKPNSKDIPGVTLNSNGEIASYDIVAQCQSVFENVRIILEAAGSSWKLLEAAGSCWKLLEAAGSCWKLLEAAGSCWKLLEALDAA